MFLFCVFVCVFACACICLFVPSCFQEIHHYIWQWCLVAKVKVYFVLLVCVDRLISQLIFRLSYRDDISMNTLRHRQQVFSFWVLKYLKIKNGFYAFYTVALEGKEFFILASIVGIKILENVFYCWCVNRKKSHHLCVFDRCWQSTQHYICLTLPYIVIPLIMLQSPHIYITSSRLLIFECKFACFCCSSNALFCGTLNPCSNYILILIRQCC